MRVALLIAAKDLRQRLRDRSALLTAIVAPLGLAVIFSQLLAGATGFYARPGSSSTSTAATSRTSCGSTSSARSSGAGVAVVHDAPTEAEGLAAVEDGTDDVAFIIPPGFTRRHPGRRAGHACASSGRATRGSRPRSRGRWRSGSAMAWSPSSCRSRRSSRSPRPPCRRPRQARIAAEAAAAAATRRARGPAGGDPPAQPADLLRGVDGDPVPVLLGADRHGQPVRGATSGTLARILAGPVRPQTVLVGKTLAAFLMGLVAMTTLVVATTLLIDADWGPPIGVAAMVVAGIISAIGIATLVTSFASTAAGGGARPTAPSPSRSGILGGTFAPTAGAPEVLATLSLLTPHGWFLRGLGDMQGTRVDRGRLPARGRGAARDGPRDGRPRDAPRAPPGGAPMIQPAKALDIARINLLRQVRDRADLFFVFVLPTIIIVALGLQFGGPGRARLGVVVPSGDAAAAELVPLLEADPTRFDVRQIADGRAAPSSRSSAGSSRPASWSRTGSPGRSPGSGTAEVGYLGTTDSLTLGLRAPVEAAVTRLGAVATAARIAVAEGAAPDWSDRGTSRGAAWSTTDPGRDGGRLAGRPGRACSPGSHSSRSGRRPSSCCSCSSRR